MSSELDPLREKIETIADNAVTKIAGYFEQYPQPLNRVASSLSRSVIIDAINEARAIVPPAFERYEAELVG